MRNIIQHLLILVITTVCYSCDINSNTDDQYKPIIEYYFGTVNTKVLENSVTIITDMPHIIINGHILENIKVKIGYQAIINNILSDELYCNITDTSNGQAIFNIEGLISSTDYVARIYIEDNANEYSSTSEDFTFTTIEHIPQYTISYETKIDTLGLFANIKFNNLKYVVDNKQIPIAIIKFEYRRSHSTPQEWIVCEYDGKIVNNNLVIELPMKGNDYLMEKSKYEYRVTIIPENTSYITYTSSINYFYTQSANIKIVVSEPKITFADGTITLLVKNIYITYDGIVSTDYPYSLTSEDYYIYWRRKGDREWIYDWIIGLNNSLVKTYYVPYVESNTVFEFKVVIFAGRGTPRTSYETDVIEFIIP